MTLKRSASKPSLRVLNPSFFNHSKTRSATSASVGPALSMLQILRANSFSSFRSIFLTTSSPRDISIEPPGLLLRSIPDDPPGGLTLHLRQLLPERATYTLSKVGQSRW